MMSEKTNIELWVELLRNDNKNVTFYMVSGAQLTGKVSSLFIIDPDLPPWVHVKDELDDTNNLVNMAHVVWVEN